MNTVDKAKWYSGLQSSLFAKWAIFWTAVSALLSQAFLQGSFATPHTTAVYFVSSWWTLIVSGAAAVVIGGSVRASNKVGYMNQVEAGTAPPPPTLPVVSPMTPPTNPTTETPSRP
jgi:hypothetical protein